MARGFTQIYGIDYYKTYAPVARLASFRLLMAIAARNGWAIDAFDFESAFLNSTLGDDEIIYLEQPVGYETRDRESWVWRLLKALYGLKQGAKNWYDALCKALAELGFTRSEAVMYHPRHTLPVHSRAFLCIPVQSLSFFHVPVIFRPLIITFCYSFTF